MTAPKDKQTEHPPGTQEKEPKARIMETAIRLFAQKGFNAVGVRELAREAGVNLSMINYFYGSKKGLFRAILADFFDNYRKQVEANIVGDDPLEVRARRTMRAAAKYFQAHKDIVIIALTELPHDDPEMIDLKVNKATRIAALFQEHLVGPLMKATGRNVPMPIVAAAIPGVLMTYFLMRPVMEKVWPAGYDDEVLRQYPDLVTEIYLNGVFGLLGYKETQGDEDV